MAGCPCEDSTGVLTFLLGFCIKKNERPQIADDPHELAVEEDLIRAERERARERIAAPTSPQSTLSFVNDPTKGLESELDDDNENSIYSPVAEPAREPEYLLDLPEASTAPPVISPSSSSRSPYA